MKNLKFILAISWALLQATALYGQDTHKITGKILSSLNKPVEGAVVTVEKTLNVTTEADGTFSVEVKDMETPISVWAPGYLPVNQLLNGRKEVVIMLIPENRYKYNEDVVLPFRGDNTKLNSYTAATNIGKKDFTLGSQKIDRALTGQVAGLQVTRMGGMPAEGSYYNLRGIRSLQGDNAPLLVINGVPYMPDKTDSPLIKGYVRDIFSAYNIHDIQNITVLKGAEAAMYGSMGSNGVILIQTDGASQDAMETQVSYYGEFGMNWNNKRMPLLSGNDYNKYLMDAGMTRYANLDDLYSNFPFLSPEEHKNAYLYNNRTDWQDVIYKKGFTTSNLFRVEGGDNIAKYDLALGYSQNNGLYENTSMDRYHTQLNANVLVSPKVNIFTTVGFAYMNGSLQEQGMNLETNPVLAAYAQSPVLSPYNKDRDGNILSTYSSYNFGNSSAVQVSNPLAIVNTLDATTRQYDLNLRAGINYTPIRDLTLSGTVGMYYNYNNEHLFIPGVSEKTIVPVSDEYGTAKNTVRDGVSSTRNYFFNLNARYAKTFKEIHQLNAMAGWQAMITRYKYEAGLGRDTSNDYYQTLDSTDDIGRQVIGYLNTWNWMNFYAHADYTYKNQWQASVNFAVDGASSTGEDANRFYVYPSVGLTWLGKGWKALQNTTWLNKLNVRAEYSLTGNSRFASTMGMYYYKAAPYQELASIVRANVPNTQLKPERNASLNVGLDVAAFQNRLNISVDYFNNRISDMICAQPLSSVYGSIPYYANIGKMDNKEWNSLYCASLIRTRDFEWIVGGNIAHSDSKVKSLGDGIDQIVNTYEGTSMVTAVGHSPYEFYGYETIGVFATQAEADEAHLMVDNGNYFRGGDMHYVDQNKDGKIDQSDRVAIGSAQPDFFGGFYSRINYKGFALSAEFNYSKGNKAYNAVRNQLEGMNTLTNQSVAVLNRWSMDGQVTDMPRVQYNDSYRSTSFSDRWIEDASFVRLKNITLSYSFSKTIWNFFRSGTLFVTGENLWTGTKYLGMDPEMAYSYSDPTQGLDYAKMMQPKSVKVGVNLKF